MKQSIRLGLVLLLLLGLSVSLALAGTKEKKGEVNDDDKVVLLKITGMF